MKYQKIWIWVVLICFCFTGCTTNEIQPHTATTFAMDTLMKFTIYDENGEQLLIDAEQEIRKLEQLFSVTIENSEIAQLNQKAGIEPVVVSEDTMNILQKGIALSEQTKGCYDMTVAPIVDVWGFTKQDYHVPTQQELSTVLPLVNYSAIELQTNTAYLQQPHMAVDLGGIAKGYASDCVTELLKQKGVSSALLWLGGNVCAIGDKPDGTPWKIVISNPLDTTDYVGMLSVTDTFVITSGGYQRYFEQDGKAYHHIIDPKTGVPADSGLLSVTIVSKYGTMADAYSTALFVMGLEDALALWRTQNDFEAVFVTTDGRVIATEGLQDCFAFEGQDNDFVFEFASRTP